MKVSDSHAQTDQIPEQHIVIAGAGRVGYQTAQVLTDCGHEVYLIERDPKTVERIIGGWTGVVIEGDAEDPQVLSRADPSQADVFAALTGDATINFAICAEMQHLSKGIRTIARVNDPNRENMSNAFIDEIVYPERTGSNATVNRIQRENIRVLEDVTKDINILNIRVHPQSPAAGKQLNEILLPDGCHVISDADGTEVARPETTLDRSRRYLSAAEPNTVDDAQKLLIG
ncbi:TrkA family potassium uptake protein [Haloquadratum walsbyi]|uniref:K+ transport system, NAD-binding component n=1 Tax=Haloquadratum walsbyi J07HQW2 TaxID=1238425 RepID=U1NCS1_9EURY|nr:TrkA family potassium uptake protein [Haloquadratum walsbyi]ERG94478.1 MAG: K+ transport system, NAD-binding component [Haloquadratum walsbyi J07HQW2]